MGELPRGGASHLAVELAFGVGGEVLVDPTHPPVIFEGAAPLPPRMEFSEGPWEEL
jgi:hypothetical protein